MNGIYISRNEKQKVFLCHRFQDVFNGLRPEDRFIDQNNDRKDNRLEHFQLLTRKENLKSSSIDRNYSFVKDNHKKIEKQ